MSHVRFGAVQQSLELQSVGISIGDNIAHLPDYGGEYEDANQVADDRENVSASKLYKIGLYVFTLKRLYGVD